MVVSILLINDFLLSLKFVLSFLEYVFKRTNDIPPCGSVYYVRYT